MDLRDDPEYAPRSDSPLDDRLRGGVAIVAHEVRAPLLAARAAIAYGVNLFVDGRDPRPWLDRATRELDALADRVDHLLAWGAGLIRMELRLTDLSQLVTDVVDSCVIDDGSVRVRLTSIDNAIVIADPRLLHTAISNLIRNALTYSPTDSPVVVSVAASTGEASVSITDRGPGIGERDDPASGVNGGQAGGSGIGLLIARSIVESLGGTVTYIHDGGGTVFRVRLPLAVEEVVPSES